jgi:predicted DNA-binding transcriptional regulator YafY
MGSNKNSFQRQMLFVIEKLRKGQPLNAKSLADELLISPSSSKRLLDRLRDDFGAPLSYDEQQKSFVLDDPTWNAPTLPVSVPDLLALALAKRHLEQASPGLTNKLAVYSEHTPQALRDQLPEEEIEEWYSVVDTRLAPAAQQIIEILLASLLNKRRAVICYRSPWSGEVTEEREISPWHLRFEEGRLYLWAFCHYRNAERLFHVLGMESVRPSTSAATPRPDDFAERFLAPAVGRYHNLSPVSVVVRVFPPYARYVCNEHWHAEQRDVWEGNELLRTFPAGSVREVALRLLSLGEWLEVVSPAQLREEIARHARILAARYRAKTD